MAEKPRWEKVLLEYRGWIIRKLDRYNLVVHRVNDPSKNFSYFGTLEYALEFIFNEILIENCYISDDNTLEGLSKSIRDTKQEFSVLLSPKQGIKRYSEGIQRLKEG